MPNPDRVVNPESNKTIKVNGPIFKQLVKSGKYQYDEANNVFKSLKEDKHEKDKHEKDKHEKEDDELSSDELLKEGEEIIDDYTPPQQAQSIIQLSNQPINYLVHISDVHIPINLHLNGRKEEYLLVFSRLYEQIELLLKQHKDVGIVITGDLLHTKIKLEPESIIMARDFLLNLSKMAPTFLITGNHDMNEYNLDQKCTLSAICHNLSDRLYYLQLSGLYQFGNRIFVVSSLKDGVFIRHSDIPEELIRNKSLVYLYHGYISGAKTDTGYVQRETKTNDKASRDTHSSRFRSTRDFEGFPLVLLGDVHKQQSLREDDTMAYASSLLQLDRGEALDRHGFLFWDLNKRSYTFYLVPNDYGFVKIKVNNGVIDQESLSKFTMPKMPIIYCNLSQTTFTQFEEVKKELIKRFKPVDIRLDNKLSTGHQLTSLAKDGGGARPVNLEEEIEMIKTSGRVIEEDLDQVIAIHQKIDGLVKREHDINYHSWDLTSLEFKNIFIYGNDIVNCIDFQSGITNITAPNRSGKSSICHMIMFALFHKTSYDITQKSDILNKWAKDGYIKLVFRYNNQFYLIHKTVSKQKRTGRKTEESDVYKTDFYRLTEQNEKIKLNGTTSTETLDVISKYVGNFDNFIANNTLLTRLSHSILYQKPTDRIKRFLNLFQLDCYEQHIRHSREIAKGLRDKLTEMRGELKALEALPSSDVDQLEKQLTRAKRELKEADSELALYNDEVEDLQDQRNSVEKELLELKSRTTEVEEPEQSREELNNRQKTVSKELEKRVIPTKSLELLEHQVGQLRIKKGDTFESCEEELDELMTLKPCSTKEELEGELHEIGSREQDLNAERKFLNNQLANLAKEDREEESEEGEEGERDEEGERGEEEGEEDANEEALKGRIETLKEELEPTSHKRETLEKKIDELSKQPFDKLKRKSIETTEELVNELLVEIGQLKASIIPEEQTIEVELEDNDYGEAILLLNETMKAVEEVPVMQTDYTEEDLQQVEDKLKIAETNITKLERLTGNIDLNATTEQLRKLILDNRDENSEITINHKFAESLVKILELSSKGTFRQLALYTSQREQNQTRIEEITSSMSHNSKVKEIQNSNNQALEHNREVEQEVNYVKNLETKNKIEQLDKKIRSYRYQIQLLKRKDELETLEQALEVVERNEERQMTINRLTKKINRLAKQQLQSKIQNNRQQLIALCEERKGLVEELEWYQQVENLKTKIAEIKQFEELSRHVETARLVIELKEVEKALQQWSQYGNDKLNREKIQTLTLKYDKVREQLADLERTLSRHRQTSFVAGQEIKKVEQDIQSAKTNSEKRSRLTVDSVDLERQVDHHKRYQELWNSKGLPLMLLKKKLKLIEPMINELFSRYTGYQLNFEVFDDTKLLVVINCKNDRDETTQLGLDRLSGSEYSILNLAFKSVCNKLSPYGRSTVFIVDESFDSLDFDNWQKALPDIFQMMKMDYLTVLFISHREIADEIIDHQIKIKKVKHYSQIG